LADSRGQAHNLKELADTKKLVVVVFLGTECPLVKLYIPRLEELASRFATNSVAFLGIDSNQQDSSDDIAAFALRYRVTFPVLKDADGKVADIFCATRTPEVFVLDTKLSVKYHGRVDDQFAVGFQKAHIGRHDLSVAIEELLAGGDPSVSQTHSVGCLIGRKPKLAPQGNVTYSNQIARLLNKRCVECHRENQFAPFPLASFEEVLGWADMIREVVDQGRMPPWPAKSDRGQFANDCRLTDAEKALLHEWIDNGCPEGDRGDLPPPNVFIDGWRIAKPDTVVFMSDEPFVVPSDGAISYQYIEADPHFSEDKWVTAAEVRPGNPAVVHHIILYICAPENRTAIRAPQGGFALGDRPQFGFAPGMPPRQFAPGQALRIPARSTLVFQVHYTSVGHEEKDRSYVGFRFCRPEEVKQRVGGLTCANTSFRIPAGDSNYEVRARHRIKKDTLLVSLFPHMHLRGKDFRFELVHPGGRRELLLDVPQYDFSWQLWYDLASPKLMPSGSELHCIAHYDNSAANPSNPDPTQQVQWGEQTWEEMMLGFVTVIDPSEKPASK
jgi:thiol-disulfide isomerase/thioredoxin